MNSLTRTRLENILADMEGKRVLVVGDVMLDRYIVGSVSRISPEAPVPVVSVKSERVALGGAANVASNVKALGGEPLLVGVTGSDETARVLADTMEERGISSEHFVTDNGRPTTIKTRIVAHIQQVVRIDHEQSVDLRTSVEKKVQSRIRKLIGGVDAVLLEDYNKGVLTSTVIRTAIREARDHQKTVTVDPKVRNFFDYRGATLFKPNEKELLGAVGEISAERIADDEFLRQVRKRIGCRNLLVTRGEKGMLLIGQRGGSFSIPTVAREVYDVSGAGDTVISSTTLALAVGATGKEAAIIANYAAGVEVSRVGVAAITPQEIIEYFDLYNDRNE